MSQGKVWFALGVLFAINLMNFYDRLILGAVGENIREDWGLSDSHLGLLGTAFIVLYALVGVPLGRLSDRANRSRILTVGVTAWSLLTAASGMAQNFWQMVVLRLTVGVGEATCAPASNSLIGDLFPATTRARAMSLFMLGLPLGNAASLLISGMVAKHYNWRMAFYVALVPGLLCALGAYMIHEPKRGATETHNIGAKKRDGSPYLLVLSIPTMCWIIASGALHNFNMYAIGSYVTPYTMRLHGADVQQAGQISMAVYGLAGVPGMLLGGLLGDAIMRRRRNGRMLLAAVAISISVPLLYFGLSQPAGELWAFGVLFGGGCAMMYVYYATVYSTIQDVIEPSLRATAMALYFFAMYLVGGAFGPSVIGAISDYSAHRAAQVDGFDFGQLDAAAQRPYRAQGLQGALYSLPIVSTLLAVTLFGGAMTVTKDAEKLQRWMREQAGNEPKKPHPEKPAKVVT